jgi:hypothetical protein
MTFKPTTTEAITSETEPPTVIIPSQGRGRSNSLPTSVVETLKRWLLTHMDHPYPSDQEKAALCQQTGIDVKRLNNWFVNNRIRYWKPKMEALQQREHKNHSSASSKQPTARGSLSLSSNKPSALLPSLILASTITNRSGLAVTTSTTKKASSKKRRSPVVSPSYSDPRTPRRSLTHSPSVVSEGSSSLVEDYEEEDRANDNDWSDSDSSSVGMMTPHQSDETSSRTTMAASPTSQRLPYKKRALQQLLSSSSSQEDEDSPLSVPRSKYSRKDEELWRESCLTSPQVNHGTLPTLDEAVLLFGFATSTYLGSHEPQA